jgi:hypothetical protein
MLVLMPKAVADRFKTFIQTVEDHQDRMKVNYALADLASGMNKVLVDLDKRITALVS